MKQFAIFNTPFWYHCTASGLLPTILDRYTLHYTPEVAAEIQKGPTTGFRFSKMARNGTVTQVQASLRKFTGLGAGDRSVLSAGLEHPDYELLIDDPPVLREAGRLRLSTRSSLALPAELYQHGHLTIETAMFRLFQLASLGNLEAWELGASAEQIQAIWRKEGVR